MDACLTGVGAKYSNFVYSCKIPEYLKLVGSIVHFEAVNIRVAIRIWRQYLYDKSVIIWCDNWAVVNAFTNYKIKDSLLMSIVRSVWLYTAKLNINLKVQHIRGKEDHLADILSASCPVNELSMADQAHKRIEAGLRPRTSRAYTATFKLFLAFVVYMGLSPPYSMNSIVLYLEFLAQKNFKASSLRNSISVIKHFFALFDWPVIALSSRKVQLLLKSVQMNAKMNVKVKGVITIEMLKKLMKLVHKYYNGVTYKALF